MASTAPHEPQPLTRLDVARFRSDFPALHQEVHGKPLVYLDNAATAQTPRPVIDAIVRFYQEDCSNIHRGVHTLSGRATELYERARGKIQEFIHAEAPEEIIFVRGTTEAVNLVAFAWGRQNLGPGDEILISTLEHHSNIVPWQQLCEATGAKLEIIGIDDRTDLDMDSFERLLGNKTKLVAITHISNALGTVVPIKAITERAHAHGVPVLVDGAQAVPHRPVDVRDLGCDFYAFSGHKAYGPMGIGVLHVRSEILETMPPFQTGGGMIRTVSFDSTTFALGALRYESGTPNVAGAIGLGATVDYLRGIGMQAIADYENELLAYAEDALADVEDLRIIGTAKNKAAVISMELGAVHAHDLGTILDREGVAIRAGHHCTQPLMEHLGLTATARASLAFYNTKEDVDALVRGLNKAREVFGL